MKFEPAIQQTRETSYFGYEGLTQLYPLPGITWPFSTGFRYAVSGLGSTDFYFLDFLSGCTTHKLSPVAALRQEAVLDSGQMEFVFDY